jgi:MFS family permease
VSSAAALARLLPDFSPAREHPAFRRLLAGGLLSMLGSSMTSFAVALQVWNLSRSSLAVGLLGLTFVPVLLVGLLGGSAADVVDRRKLALVTSTCLMVVSGAFAAQAYAGLGRRPLLVAAFLTDLDAMLLGLPVALFPALNAAHFGGSPRTLGLLNAAVGVGGLLSAVLSGPAARVSRQGRGMLAGTMIWGAAIALFGVTGSLAVALLMLAVAGAADTLTVTFRAAMVQAVTPDEFRGRVSSVEYIIGNGGGPLGNVESGTVASLTTPAVSAVSGGLGCLAIAALIGLLCPAFVRYRATTG